MEQVARLYLIRQLHQTGILQTVMNASVVDGTTPMVSGLPEACTLVVFMLYWQMVLFALSLTQSTSMSGNVLAISTMATSLATSNKE